VAQDKLVTITTPAGIAIYPSLHAPDTRFKDAGVYSTKLRIAAGPEADALEATLEEHAAAAVVTAKKENPGKKNIKAADMPFSRDEDTNDLIVNIKMTASGVSKKTGKPWSMRPKLYDAKGKPLPHGVKVGGGSVLRVAFQPAPFWTALVGAGITLRMEAVQVIELKSWGEKSADAFGFGAEEGFDSEADSFDTFGGETAAEGPKADAEQDDF
jgi:hypothetical protein